MPKTPSASDFYQDHCHDYFVRTVSVDPAPFLTPFINRLPRRATVLDLGCGSGRDLLWLKNRGYKVIGFERSPGLAELARTHADCDIIVGDFERFDFSRFSVDAVMASGSLVHISHQRLAGVLAGILTALKPAGLLYISLKQGHGIKTDPFGRTFYLWENNRLIDLWTHLGLRSVHFSSSRSALNSKDDWLACVLITEDTGRPKAYPR